jgi:hypothetical protein
MKPATEDIKDMLEADSGIALVLGTDLFIGREPNEPNNCATLFDTPGRPRLTGVTDLRYDYPSVQVRVRNTGYVDGWTLINDIALALHQRDKEIRNGSQYESIACVVEPALLDWDENDRARFVTTFDIQRRPSQ